MLIYRCTKHDADMGTLLSWHSNRREAEGALRLHQRQRGGPAQGPEKVEAIDILTDRRSLISWLNRHVRTENG